MKGSQKGSPLKSNIINFVKFIIFVYFKIQGTIFKKNLNIHSAKIEAILFLRRSSVYIVGHTLCLVVINMACIIIFQDLAHGLRELIEYEGDVDEDFGMTFQVSFIYLWKLVY